MMQVVAYTAQRCDEWNSFVSEAKNATFLFSRSYMDYHQDRFRDSSLMVYDHRQRLFALFPANRVGETVFSHQGLTYGGLVIGGKATAAEVCEAMTAVNGHLRKEGVERLVCKALPYIYCAVPSDEPLYAFTEVCHARLVSRDIASVVSYEHQLPSTELRRRGKRKAERQGIRVAYSDDFPAFWAILSENLHTKYGARPVHTLEEILLLKSRFPQSIRLLAAFEQQQMVAGTVLYLTPRVVKTQYISASPRGKDVCALDLLFSRLMAEPPGSQAYLDMGTSALEHGSQLLLPLIFQKEGFGARAVCYDTYEWTL